MICEKFHRADQPVCRGMQSIDGRGNLKAHIDHRGGREETPSAALRPRRPMPPLEEGLIGAPSPSRRD